MLKLWMAVVLCSGMAVGASDKDVERLIDVLCVIESNGDVNAVSDAGRAIGILQIWPIYVRDANRILKLRKSKVRYTLADRWDRAKSRAITKIVITHYGKGSIETMARAHHCPPKRYHRDTLKYWYLVKKRLYAGK